MIGASKSGTTTLHNWLASHPQVQMSRPKELNFFADDGTWDRGPEWYASHFDAPGKRVYGETSPRYTSVPDGRHAPERIRRLVPDARLVYLLRDPVERMVSHWRMRSAEGRDRRPIDEALTDDFYLGRSRYHFQLQRFLAHFPEEQILLLDLDDLGRANRRETIRGLHRHLGVDEDHRSIHHLRRYFPRAHPRIARLSLRAARAATLARVPARHPEPSPELRAYLVDQLKDDVAALRDLTGRRFGGWPL